MAHTRPLRLRNAAFLLDRLAADCAPLQEYRELTHNSLQAVIRALNDGLVSHGEILWDVDWAAVDTAGVYKLCVIDNGDGMTGEDMQKYINELSSSGGEQSLEGNFGVGAKITAGTHNPEGLVYMSWREDSGSMIHFWLDPDTSEYGLKQFQVADTYAHCVGVPPELKPADLGEFGTKVVLLGTTPDENTAVPPKGASYPTHWLVRYLNRRYFAFPEKVRVRVREFSKRDPREWPVTETNKMAEGAQLREVHGQKYYLDRHAEASGVVPLGSGTASWWLLPDDKRMREQLDIWQTTGHTGALYDSELYDLRDGVGGKRLLQNFGVLFGTTRVVIYVEPSNGTRRVTANTARSTLLVDGQPLPWEEWGEEFRKNMPDAIQQMMDELLAKDTEKDHAESIKERLAAIRELFKVSRYRRTAGGLLEVAGEGPGGLPGAGTSRNGGGGRGGGRGGRRGDIYAAFLQADGEKADEVKPKADEPTVTWVNSASGTRDSDMLEDRAASYLPGEHRILANGDFRVFADMVGYFAKLYGDASGTRELIEDVVREWFEQQLIETVIGVRALKGSKLWDDDMIERALSDEALTAAVMPRYHVFTAIKRTLGVRLGSLKGREFDEVHASSAPNQVPAASNALDGEAAVAGA
jgi:hypothetical protein